MPSFWVQTLRNEMIEYNSADRVQGMFRSIAGRYDLMNRLMTAGQDTRWRREVIRRTDLPSDGKLLDVGAGTGDLAREALHQHPACWPIAADFTIEMMQVGKESHTSTILDWSAADALALPFPNGIFDAVVSGFLLRNVTNIDQALGEQFRVLKPGGSLVALDTTRPEKNLLWPLINLYLHFVIPNLGRLITGQGEAYTYLPDSTEAFLEAEQLLTRMESVGFKEAGFRRFMFGTVAIHWAKK
jgi:demethylmenaquinone methyltransferase/2-methoxy-6-polyprenyl-1,4-benzoquinol methylase